MTGYKKSRIRVSCSNTGLITGQRKNKQVCEQSDILNTFYYIGWNALNSWKLLRKSSIPNPLKKCVEPGKKKEKKYRSNDLDRYKTACLSSSRTPNCLLEMKNSHRENVFKIHCLRSSQCKEPITTFIWCLCSLFADHFFKFLRCNYTFHMHLWDI